MLSRGWNLGEDASDIIGAVDPLRLCGAGIVSGALGEVEYLTLAGEQLQACEADGRAHHVAREGLDRLVVCGGECDGVVDRLELSRDGS